jgi:hypothetical protein
MLFGRMMRVDCSWGCHVRLRQVWCGETCRWGCWWHGKYYQWRSEVNQKVYAQAKGRRLLAA